MTDSNPDTRLDAWRFFITLHPKVIAKIDGDLQQNGGISLQQYDVLIELFEAEGKQLRMFDLAQRVVLSRSSITRLVDQLAQQGFLQREIDPNDRRGSYAVLTDAGEAAIRSSWPLYRDAIQEWFGQFLTDEEAEIMAKALNRIHNGIDQQLT